MSPFCSSKIPQPGLRAGNAIVEFAVAFSLLWTCLAGIFQFGYAIYIYNALAIAVNNGAQYGATVDFDATAQTFVQKIQNVTVYGSPSGGGTSLAPGLLPSQVSVTWITDTSGLPQSITVSIQAYSCNAIFQNFSWTNKPSMTVRFMGVFKT